MFGVYFGRYLVNKGIITLEEYNSIIYDSKNTKVRLGVLAIEEGLMTSEQVEEVNSLQQIQDKRFGDIAVEKGYLTDSQVDNLLKRQGDEYLLFVQALVDKNLMTLDAIQKEINIYRKENRFTALDLEAIKSGDIDRIVPIFTNDESVQPIVKDYVALVARNFVRFMDSRFEMETIRQVDLYESSYMSMQELDGDYRMLTGFCGELDGLQLIGETFVKREYPEIELADMDIMDILDAACEFLNCNNGLYAARVSNEEIDLDMCPPTMRDTASSIQSDGNMYMVRFYIKGKHIDLIIGIQSKWKID